MDYSALRSEVLTDPVALGYVGKTDQATADLLNSLTTGRTRPNTAVPVPQIFNNIVDADWPAPASLAESKLHALLSMQTIDASNANTRTIIGAIFAAGTTTRTNLLAIQNVTISRAQELGLPPPLAIDVTKARAGVW